MLDVFKGEFFHHPAALEYSGNTCSHACAYCFANTRSADRRFSIAALAKLCLGKSKSDTWMKYLFNCGQAVCISNRTDPFGKSNADNTPTVLELMDLVPNGVYFQTKGLSDERNWDVLDRFKKKNVVMYITISGKRDEVLKRVEPGAPCYAERVKLAKYAKERGWCVSIGVNPCWEKWFSESEIIEMEDELRGFGVDQFFIQSLSMNRKTWAGLSEDRRNRIGAADAEGAFVWNSKEKSYYMDQAFRMMEKGLRPFTMFLAYRTDYDDCTALGKYITPMRKFINHAFDESAASGKFVFTFGDFIRFMLDGKEELANYESREFNKYILAINRNLWKQSNAAKSAKNIIDLYRLAWNDRMLMFAPWTYNSFVAIGKDGKIERDEDGNVICGFLGEAGLGCVHSQVMTVEEVRERREVIA